MKKEVIVYDSNGNKEQIYMEEKVGHQPGTISHDEKLYYSYTTKDGVLCTRIRDYLIVPGQNRKLYFKNPITVTAKILLTSDGPMNVLGHEKLIVGEYGDSEYSIYWTDERSNVIDISEYGYESHKVAGSLVLQKIPKEQIE